MGLGGDCAGAAQLGTNSVAVAQIIRLPMLGVGATSSSGAVWQLVQAASRRGRRRWEMAKHRRSKTKAPVDYGIVLISAAVIAGALMFHAIMISGWIDIAEWPQLRHPP